MSEQSIFPRFREAGQRADDDNVREYGEPVRSLFTSKRLLALDHHIDITDEKGKIVYVSRSRILSIHDKTDITDAKGRNVAHIERKFFTLHERHFISMADGTRFEMSNELLHIIRDVTNIEGLGWKLCGNIIGLNFELRDQNGRVIAVINQKFISLHDKYCVDIYQPEHEKAVVAILVTLQHMVKDREDDAAASSSSSGND